ncbi:hypothetical protein [Cohnella silvisoli]|uniref:Uncharacterized protein n=1 Tax=Cohnella silvisoli TaxID=2873699 RepID=A0ABV1KUG6_9BACL|nr:hypothetical protein [Cohnella silvisoli]
MAKQAAIDEAKKNCGYFALIRNVLSDPVVIFESVRSLTRNENCFSN